MIDLNLSFGNRKRVVLTILICFAASMIASSLLAIPTKAQAPVLNGTETQITTNPASQTDPAISGNYIVYTDNRNGQLDVYLYDVTNGEEADLTPGTPNDQYWNDIDGVSIVYTNVVSGGADIYLHDISTALATPLTTSGTNYSPSINGDLVAWILRVGAAYNIVLADLKERTSTILTNDPPSVSGPRVDDGIVVWAELIGDWDQIRTYNYVSGEYRTITSNPATHRNPDVSGTKVVWTSNENGNWDIYLHDLVTGVTTQLTYNVADQIYPRVDDNNVIWEDMRSGTRQIWFMNLDEGLEMPVSPTGHLQVLNAIDGNHIAWTESRYGNNDIFMFTFTLGPPADTTPPTTAITLSGIMGERGWYKSDVTVTLTATDDLSGVASTYISLDNGATWQQYTSPVTVTEGLNNIKYYSTDNQGNTETTKYAFALIDKTAPTLTILEPLPGDYYSFETINMVILANDQPEESGLWEISAHLDDTWVPINETIDLSPLSPGTHTLTVTAIDQPGWITTREVTFNIIAITTTIDVNKQLNRDTRSDVGNGRLVSKTTIVNKGNPIIKIEDYEQFPDSFILQKIIVKIFDPSNPAYKYEIQPPYYTVQYGTYSVTITINFPTTATLSYQNPDGTWTTQQITLNTLPTNWGAQFQTILTPPSELIPGTYTTTATITAWTAPNTYTIEIATATLTIEEKKTPP